MAKVDLSKIKPRTAKATFVLNHLPGRKEKQMTFSQKITVVKSESVSHGTHDDGHDDHDHGHNETSMIMITITITNGFDRIGQRD